VFADADVCFRKYNAERDGCKGQIHGQTSLDADACCLDGGQGHATQVSIVLYNCVHESLLSGLIEDFDQH